MATQAQITANRLNAQKSTGPSTAEGKAASRFNALKHAATARSLVIPGEDEAVLAELSAAYYDQFQPVGPEEALLVEKIVASDWTQRRMRRLEAEVTNALVAKLDDGEPHSFGAAFLKDSEGSNALQKIFRAREAASREWFRAIAELKERQFNRFAAAPPPPVPARPQPRDIQPPVSAAQRPVLELRAPVPTPRSAPPQPPARPKIGFVFDESTPREWRL